MRVMHIITRMIVGGAQENTLFNCVDLVRHHNDTVCLVTGPSLGAEGDLLSRNDTQLLEIETIDSLRRAIHPVHDTKRTARSSDRSCDGSRTLSIRTAPKGGFSVVLRLGVSRSRA